MEWWVWVLIVVVILAIVVGTIAWIQSRRRAGGVVALSDDRDAGGGDA